MVYFIFLFALDNALSRPSIALLPQQALMEIFMEDFDLPQPMDFRDESGAFRDACQWPRVDCDSDGSVQKFQLRGIPNKGKMQPKYLPRSIEVFTSAGADICCVLHFSDFHETLRRLDVSKNQMSGTVDVAVLPMALESFNIRHNLFSGSLDLTKLPQNIAAFDVRCNQFSGSVNLTQLPQTLKRLSLSRNDFSGNVSVILIQSLHIDIAQTKMTCVVDACVSEICD